MQSEGVLLLHGYVFGSVTQTSTSLKTQAPSGVISFIASVRDLYDPTSKSYYEYAFFLTLIGGSINGDTLAPRKNLLAIASFLTHLSETQNFDLPHTLPPKASHQEWQLAQSARDLGNACYNRRLFLTDDGFLGLGPESLEHGDLIVVVYGGEWPFALRPSGDKYLLLGPYYVAGDAEEDIMFGSVMRKSIEQGIPAREFRIRRTMRLECRMIDPHPVEHSSIFYSTPTPTLNTLPGQKHSPMKCAIPSGQHRGQCCSHPTFWMTMHSLALQTTSNAAHYYSCQC